MQKTFILWCLVLFGTSTAVGQFGGGEAYRPSYPLEIGIQAGTAHYLGDLGGVGRPGFAPSSPEFQRGIGQGFIVDTDLEATRPTFGIFGRWNFNGNFAARVDLNYLQISGNDEYAGRNNSNFSPTQPRIDLNAAWFRYYRNLSFRSHVFDANIALEITPYNFELGSGRGSSVLAPYGFMGIGLFAFNPQTFHEGAWVDLKPLRTEGQGLVTGRPEYDLVQMNVPMGFGVKWIYNDQWSLALEVNYRLTFTDYIDDVSIDYVEDEGIFGEFFDPSTAALALQLARRSDELDPSGVNSEVTAAGEQRGDPKDNDAYYTVTIRFGYFINTNAFGNRSRARCPVW